MAKQKLYIGPRLRRLRRDLGLTQAAMAADLEVSPSYVNLIERNQRPLSAELLLRLAATYDLDLEAFADDGGEELFARLAEAMKDPIFAKAEVTRADLQELAAGNPVLAEAVVALYAAYRDSAQSLAEAQMARSELAADSPLEEARAFIQTHRNYFDDLDRAAELMHGELAPAPGALWSALMARAKDRHGLTVRLLPDEVMAGALRRFERHRNQIVIAEGLDRASRNFQLALQLVFIELHANLDRLVDGAAFGSPNAARITRTALANYAAAAMLMPYGAFHMAAEEFGFDIEALSRRFGTSFEQTCHRLTTLQRPGAEGVPFFFLRVDAAGNVSKRFDGGGVPFARYGGSCPLWNVHETFGSYRKIFTQIIELPDGERFFSIARTVSGGLAGFNEAKAVRAVALGCALSEAGRLSYTRGLDLEAAPATPIGATCRLCTRPDCAARAHPPMHHRLLPEDYRKGAVPFSFAVE